MSRTRSLPVAETADPESDRSFPDRDYEGSIILTLDNYGSKTVELERGDACVQLLVQTYYVGKAKGALCESSRRGKGAFGSTDRHDTTDGTDEDNLELDFEFDAELGACVRRVAECAPLPQPKDVAGEPQKRQEQQRPPPEMAGRGRGDLQEDDEKTAEPRPAAGGRPGSQDDDQE